ncbi:hypothetical protein AB1N83_006644, partial [Pleurotus pulmonarius]
MPASSSSTSSSQSPAASSTSASSPAQKKKHVCPTCERAFTTSGHLARHSRVHTGERNHKCPFPGCETRCSRQDNLQQHYRIHLSPGSRRSSSRSAIARAMNGGKRGSAALALQQAQAAAAQAAGLDPHHLSSSQHQLHGGPPHLSPALSSSSSPHALHHSPNPSLIPPPLSAPPALEPARL